MNYTPGRQSRFVNSDQLSQIAVFAVSAFPLGRQQLSLTQLSDAINHRGREAVFASCITQPDGSPAAAAIAIRFADDAAMLLGLHAIDLGLLQGVATALHQQLRAAGVGFVQAAWDTGGTAPPFAAAGYEQIATLQYLSLKIEQADSWARELPTGFAWEIFNVHDPSQCERMQAVVQSSFEATLDCPQLSGFRSPRQIFSGYQSAPGFDPSAWLILTHLSKDIGCLLTTRHQDAGVLELTYMGLIPQHRGKGVGALLVRQAIQLAMQWQCQQLILAVDRENSPANRAYRDVGMQRVADETVWGRSTATLAKATGLPATAADHEESEDPR